MAAQGLLCRASWSFSNCRVFLNNRLAPFAQTAGVRKNADALKDLNLPEKPKRPLSPYFRFFHEHRSAILKEHPDWKVTQVSVQCAADWKKIDPVDKQRYESQYKADMEKYAVKYLQYTKSLTEEQKEAISNLNKNLKKLKLSRERRKKIRELDRPKRPIGAYMLFVAEQAKLHPEKSYIKLASELKDKWAELPEGEKAKYTLPTAKAFEKYDEELKQWELEMIKKGNVDVVRKTTLAGEVPKPKKRTASSKKSQKSKESDDEC